jgi:hypothetical protein
MQTVANISGLQIRRLETSDAALYRDIRLEALKQNPEAFGSTFERENTRPLSWFEAAIGRSDIFGAFLDGTLAGIADMSRSKVRSKRIKRCSGGCMFDPLAENRVLGKGLLRPCSVMRAGVWRWSSSLS